jgi:hypothetical protein
LNTNSRLIYDGPSETDGKRILMILSGIAQKSINDKTRDMAQTFIILADEAPSIVAKAGNDTSVCGECALRPVVAKQLRLRINSYGDADIAPKVLQCYVDKVRGPDGIWQSWNMGNIETMTPAEAGALVATLRTCNCEKPHKRTNCKTAGTPLGIRLGAYGDPASVPKRVWSELLEPLSESAKMTSYTHQWETHPELAEYTMASVDPSTWPDVHDALDRAHALGFRTYRVLATGETPRADEIICPEASGATKCNRCGLCAGNRRPKTPNIAVQAIT